MTRTMTNLKIRVYDWRSALADVEIQTPEQARLRLTEISVAIDMIAQQLRVARYVPDEWDSPEEYRSWRLSAEQAFAAYQLDYARVDWQLAEWQEVERIRLLGYEKLSAQAVRRIDTIRAQHDAALAEILASLSPYDASDPFARQAISLRKRKVELDATIARMKQLEASTKTACADLSIPRLVQRKILAELSQKRTDLTIQLSSIDRQLTQYVILGKSEAGKLRAEIRKLYTAMCTSPPAEIQGLINKLQ